MESNVVNPAALLDECFALIQAARIRLVDPQAKLIVVIPDYQFRAIRLYWAQYPEVAHKVRGTTDSCRCSDTVYGCCVRTSRVLDNIVVY